MKKEKFCYFDNAASTRPIRESLERFIEVESSVYANPSSVHEVGKTARRIVEDSRKKITSLLNIDDKEYNVVFTSGASESNGIILQSALKHQVGSSVIVSDVEHESITANESILKANGVEMIKVHSPFGFADADDVAEKITDKTTVASIIHVNNVTGAVNDIRAIAEKAKLKNSRLLFHSDATQGVLSGYFGFRKDHKCKVDAFSISSHKLFCPKGIGLLIVRKGLSPQLSSSGGQEYGLRGGTQSVGLIAAFASGLEHIFENADSIRKKFFAMKEIVVGEIEKEEKMSVVRAGGGEYCDGIVCVSSKVLPGEVMQRILSDKGFMIGTTSACSSNSPKPSGNVILKMGYDGKIARGILRISFGLDNTASQTLDLVKSIREAASAF